MKKEILILLFICPLVFFYVFSQNMKSNNNKREQSSHLTLEDSFEKLEGSDTSNWNYIQTKRDYRDLECFKTLYKKNYKHQFNSNPSFKIPKIIHLIWIGPKPFPSGSVENIRTWMAHHPDWTFNFWTDRKRLPPCNGMQVKQLKDFHFEFLHDKFKESKNWGEKADIWRYEILYQQGGLYIDHDAACVRPFHGLHTGYDFYAGLEMPHEEIDSLALTAGIGVIGAKPRHPALQETIRLILERWDAVTEKFSASDPLVQARRVTHRTLIAFTHAFEKGLNQPGNTDIIFPACYFYPKGNLPGFYSEHLYGTTWNNLNETPNEQFFQKMLRHLRNRDAKIIHVELMSLFALIGCFSLYFLINREIKRKKTQ